MNTPLAVAMVCYPSLGGSGVIAAELAVGLAGAGHVVHVIASDPPSRALPESDRLFFHEVAVSTRPLYDNPPYDMAVAATILNVCSEHRLDLVHVHYAVPHATSALLARRVLGDAAPKFVCTLHGTDVTRKFPDPGYRELTRVSVESCDGVTVPSHYLREQSHVQLGLPRELGIEVIPNFVDTSHFTPTAVRDASRLEHLFSSAGSEGGGGPVLFHVSNFRAVKRVGDLMDVLERVRRQVPARLVLVGDGPERSFALQRARELGVAGAVCFLGKRSDFVEHLRHADAFLLPSQNESFGVAALEAMSAGVPVFGYRVGGLPEVVTDDVGTLVEPFDVDALAAAVLDVIRSPARRAGLAAAARARATQHFRRETALDRYLGCYRRVLGAREAA